MGDVNARDTAPLLQLVARWLARLLRRGGVEQARVSAGECEGWRGARKPGGTGSLPTRGRAEECLERDLALCEAGPCPGDYGAVSGETP